MAALHTSVRRALPVILAFVGVAVVLLARFTMAPSQTLDWPEEGMLIEPDSAEEMVASLLEAISQSDWETVSSLATIRHGTPSGVHAGQTIGSALEIMGKLTRWMVVDSLPGVPGDSKTPTRIRVYCRFSRVGDVALTVEAFPDPEGWRFRNITTSDSWAPGFRAPEWVVGRTTYLELRVWPGHQQDMDYLLASGDSAVDRAVWPLGGIQSLPETVLAPATVFVFRSLRDLEAAIGQDLPEWIVGMTVGDSVLILSSSSMDQKFSSILTHELNHLYLGRYLLAVAEEADGAPGSVPAWLSEGMAGLAANQYIGNLQLVNESSSVLPTLDQLATPFRDNPTPQCYQFAYSVAEYMTQYAGPSALRDMVDLVATGKAWEDALKIVTGLSVDEFTASWHAWLRTGTG